jgi:lysine-N-methylase
MSLPLRHLPVLQSWDCHGCTNCCREYQVPITPVERERIVAQGWTDDGTLKESDLFLEQGPPWARRYFLNHSDSGCIFLSEQGRCRIHERFGAEAKPLACRVYPFILVPVGDHWRVGMRFSCPSAAANRGRALREHEPALIEFARLIEEREGLDQGKKLLPPALQRGRRVEWSDLGHFGQALLGLLRNRGERVHQRLRKCLALARLCRHAQFAKIQGKRLVEFLNLVGAAADADVPANPEAVPRPGWIGRVLFRPIVALYARQDHGPERGPAQRGRLALLAAGLRFARGHGTVPRLHRLLPETTFEHLEEPAGALPEAAEQVLERYYSVKVSSLQFCGPANFGLPFWDGFETLALTYPAILWLTRAFADVPREEAVIRAVRIVDNHFGYNPLLGNLRHRLVAGILARWGELDKLIAWYSR